MALIATPTSATAHPPPSRDAPAAGAAVDQLAGGYRLVSIRPDGEPADGDSTYGEISDDGRFVMFWSDDSSLVQGEEISGRQLYRHDRSTRLNTLVTRDVDGSPSDDESYSSVAAMTGDSGLVVFESGATDLVPDDDNGSTDVFLWDPATGVITMISRSPEGDPGDSSSTVPDISADGSTVVFSSVATNLIGGEPVLGIHVYSYDVVTGEISLIDKALGGGPSEGLSFGAAVSADGTRIVYNTSSDDVIPGDTNQSTDIVMWDSTTETTELVSQTEDGGFPDDSSYWPTISDDGRHVAFASYADLVGPHSGADQLYWRDTETGQTTMITRGVDGRAGNKSNYDPAAPTSPPAETSSRTSRRRETSWSTTTTGSVMSSSSTLRPA